MEVNKDEAERCKLIGASAMKEGQYDRAVKFFRKSLSLYPLPGVQALLAAAERKMEAGGDEDGDDATNSNSNTTNSASASNNTPPTTTATPTSASTRSSSSSQQNNTHGRAYTQAQVEIVETILRAKAQGGRTAHYKVLNISATECTEADIKKAYRKLAVKVHPDKNSAPKADEAFKAVGLAYATLSDPQKKAIYDRYGDEDPDNRGGGSTGMRHRGPGGMHFRPGDEVSPEDIFNMFFGGGMPGGGMHRGPGGMHFYSSFGGPGGFARAAQQQQQRRRGQQQQQAQGQQEHDNAPPGMATLMQLLPFLLILILSFLKMNETSYGHSATSSGRSPGQNRYFSLTKKEPFVNPMHTKLTAVKDIPYFVDNKFVKTLYRDRYQLAQVERMVENAYENYLVEECNKQRRHKKQMLSEAAKKPTVEEQESAEKEAQQIQLTRCVELNELFPLRHSGRKR
ncbi:chaperone protein DnaJ [Nitzschia inconspicua]|uniref:Chaperone protein DnaJ n=1 Tax=Nitzschia inconspicua TaxID=303405 RepID=A0A9K3PYI0_9STRA|nr:chaperone protein DnaJ [Nitzschia inconspicua]